MVTWADLDGFGWDTKVDQLPDTAKKNTVQHNTHILATGQQIVPVKITNCMSKPDDMQSKVTDNHASSKCTTKGRKGFSRYIRPRTCRQLV